jgi:hypothetical protein
MYEIDKKEQALKEGHPIAAPKPADASTPDVSAARA